MISGLEQPAGRADDASASVKDPANAESLAACGSLIGDKYRVEHVLGEGAMGIVLAARHVVLGELVAIKCIRATVPWSPDVIARFAREAKACARLKSEHIAKVIDVGVSPNVGPYMVMEHLEGEDLATALRRRGPLSVRRAAEYVMQVCEALAVAHAASITHRDVKPENLFLTRHGDLEIIKVLDFGISKDRLAARGSRGEPALTETQSLMGTPLYMSPEQIRSTREVDHRSDLWSLGVVLFELLTGRPAFAGDTVTQVCARVLEADPPSLAEHCRDAPAELSAIVERCLRKDPAERFQSAADLAGALLPFAPPRARLHAERATSVSRALSSDPDEALPSTRREGRGAVPPSLETTAPTVLGADPAPKADGHRLLLAPLCVLALGLGFFGFRALLGATPDPNLSAAHLAPARAPEPQRPMPGRSEASDLGERRPSSLPADDVAPRSVPAPISKRSTSGGRKTRPSPGGAPPAARLNKLETPPLAATSTPERATTSAKARPRLVDAPSPVRLLD